MKLPAHLRFLWQIVKPAVLDWLMTRGLYLSDEDLARIANRTNLPKSEIESVYRAVRQIVLERVSAL